MDSLKAFTLGKLNKGKPFRVFDWVKAAELIKQHRPVEASAGLRDDWEWTGGTIYRKGKPVLNEYTYLASNWAIPELDMDGTVLECWKYQHDTLGWDSDTKWPEEALKILVA